MLGTRGYNIKARFALRWRGSKIKTSIKRVSYNSNFKLEDPKSKWFTWQATCDKCGVVIRRFGDAGVLFPNDETPNTMEKDYCIDCLLDWYETEGLIDDCSNINT